MQNFMPDILIHSDFDLTYYSTYRAIAVLIVSHVIIRFKYYDNYIRVYMVVISFYKSSWVGYKTINQTLDFFSIYSVIGIQICM